MSGVNGMKNLMSVIGIALIIFGLGTFAYKGFHYTTQEKIVQVGDVQVTAEKEKTIYLPPILGGTSIAVGIILLVVARMNRPKL